MVTFSEIGRIYREANPLCFKLLFQHSYGWEKKNHEIVSNVVSVSDDVRAKYKSEDFLEKLAVYREYLEFYCFVYVHNFLILKYSV